VESARVVAISRDADSLRVAVHGIAGRQQTAGLIDRGHAWVQYRKIQNSWLFPGSQEKHTPLSRPISQLSTSDEQTVILGCWRTKPPLEKASTGAIDDFAVGHVNGRGRKDPLHVPFEHSLSRLLARLSKPRGSFELRQPLGDQILFLISRQAQQSQSAPRANALRHRRGGQRLRIRSDTQEEDMLVIQAHEARGPEVEPEPFGLWRDCFNQISHAQEIVQGLLQEITHVARGLGKLTQGVAAAVN